MTNNLRGCTRMHPRISDITQWAHDIAGQQCGIIEAQFGKPLATPMRSAFTTMFGRMPEYHRIVLFDKCEIAYHLAGYGISLEEAFIRLLGESIERYASIMGALLFQDRIEYASYREIGKKGAVIPFEYIRIYTDDDYEKLKTHAPWRPIDEDDRIGWLRCPSIFDAGEELYIPLQFLFVGQRYRFQRNAPETLFMPGFSKGTAAHTGFHKALRNALLEAIETDAAMLGWYAMPQMPCIEADHPILNDIFTGKLSHLDDYTVRIRKAPACVDDVFAVITMLHSKTARSPNFVFSSNAEFSPVACVYRAVMEAAALQPYLEGACLYQPDNYFKREKCMFADLDSNTVYYADPANRETVLPLLEATTGPSRKLTDYTDGSGVSAEEDVARLISELRKTLRYGVYLNITPPEAGERGWQVARVFFPELLTMSLPGYPYSNHPRLKNAGGLRNNLPHPFA